MGHASAGVETLLFRRLQRRGGRAARFAILDEGVERLILPSQHRRDRVLGRNGREARAEYRVGAGREDLEIRCAAYRLAQLAAELVALALADPALLPQTDLVGPLVEPVLAVERSDEHTSELQALMRLPYARS